MVADAQPQCVGDLFRKHDLVRMRPEQPAFLQLQVTGCHQWLDVGLRDAQHGDWTGNAQRRCKDVQAVFRQNRRHVRVRSDLGNESRGEGQVNGIHVAEIGQAAQRAGLEMLDNRVQRADHNADAQCRQCDEAYQQQRRALVATVIGKGRQGVHCHLLSMTDTESSLDNIHATVPALAATTASGMGSVNSQGAGLKKSRLRPLGP